MSIYCGTNRRIRNKSGDLYNDLGFNENDQKYCIKQSIQPHFDYCSQVWGCLGKVLLDKLQRFQNRVFCIIFREGYETRSKDILNN